MEDTVLDTGHSKNYLRSDLVSKKKMGVPGS